MTKYALVLASVSALWGVPSFAAAQTFVRDGVTYEYSVRDAGSYQVVNGRDTATGETFTLKIRGSRVAGQYAGAHVAFEAPKADQQVASR